MKNQYKKLYVNWQAKFKEFVKNNSSRKITGPLLISPPINYCKQKNKIMIIGQETFGWHSEISDIEEQMKRTEEFNLGENYTCSPFWNFFYKVEEIFGNEKRSSLWTNIHKFDLNNGALDLDGKKEIKEINKIIIEEIEIGKPEVCIFFTSHNRDKELEQIYEGIKFEKIEGWDTKWLVLLKHPKLPQLSIRTYHPRYIRMKKKETSFFETLKNIKVLLI